jgi:hypothetical protein
MNYDLSIQVMHVPLCLTFILFASVGVISPQRLFMAFWEEASSPKSKGSDIPRRPVKECIIDIVRRMKNMPYARHLAIYICI